MFGELFSIVFVIVGKYGLVDGGNALLDFYERCDAESPVESG